MSVTNSFLMPPRIETPRLRLRSIREDDWHSLHEHYSDEICTRFTFRRVLTEGESWRAMASMVGHWLLRGYGPYTVEQQEAGVVLGVVGLWYPIDWPEPEIKWALVRRYWGQGFASEATRAVQAAAATHLPKLSLISLIHSENSASIRLAAAVGAAFDRQIDFRSAIYNIYRHPRRV
jgi:RimJ/RimL family protein N-acetyltransferase